MYKQSELVQEIPRLEKFAYKLCSSRADAQDLLQASLLRALEKRVLYEPHAPLFSWVSKIMYNLFVNDYRRRAKFETQYDPEPKINAQSIPPRQEQLQELSVIQEAISKLSKEHRNALIMICVNGLKYKEASKILKIPVGTVRSRLSRAREELREFLDQEDVMTDTVQNTARPVSCSNRK